MNAADHQLPDQPQGHDVARARADKARLAGYREVAEDLVLAAARAGVLDVHERTLQRSCLLSENAMRTLSPPAKTGLLAFRCRRLYFSLVDWVWCLLLGRGHMGTKERGDLSHAKEFAWACLCVHVVALLAVCVCVCFVVGLCACVYLWRIIL